MIYFKDVFPEDIEAVLEKIEKSFDIEFQAGELAGEWTFGEVCDHIINKIKLEHTESCSAQQAFYKLRKAIKSALDVDVTPQSDLKDILPRAERIRKVKRIERHLGFELSILQPHTIVMISLLITFLVSLCTLYFIPLVAIAGLGISIAGFQVANMTGKEMNLETVGDLARKMTCENYLLSRRNPVTINKNELGQVFIYLFSDHLGIDQSEFTGDTIFSKRENHTMAL